MYRATRMNSVLLRIAHAYATNHEDFNDPSLWAEVESALNMSKGSLGRRTLTDMQNNIFRENDSSRAKERNK